jgi:hypothetical protein
MATGPGLLAARLVALESCSLWLCYTSSYRWECETDRRIESCKYLCCYNSLCREGTSLFPLCCDESFTRRERGYSRVGERRTEESRTEERRTEERKRGGAAPLSGTHQSRTRCSRLSESKQEKELVCIPSVCLCSSKRRTATVKGD